MIDILKQADGFRLGVRPKPADIDKANWIIDRLSAEVVRLRKEEAIYNAVQ